MVNKYDMMKYQDNKAAIQLGYAALGANTVFLIYALNTVTPDFFVGLKILLNILIMLLVLLFAEESKKYVTSAGYKLMALGGLALLRILWIPMKIMNDATLPNEMGRNLMIALIIEGLLLIAAGVITVKKSSGLEKYLRSNEVK